MTPPNSRTPPVLKEVKMTITKQLEVSWLCPNCDILNTKYFFSAPGKTKLHCGYCGGNFLGVR